VQSFSNRKANPYYARLNDLGVISKDGMCDMQKMDMLSIGAIGQLFNVIRGLAKRLGVSEDELYELAKQY
jgi:mevalonate kinase